MNEMTKLILLLDDVALPQTAIRFLVENFSESDLLSNLESNRERIVKGTKEAVYLKIKNAISTKNIEKTLLKLQKYGINAISYYDPEYPETLKEIPNPPMVLYYKGDVNLLKEKSIAIVGTRRPTNYGREVTRYFASTLSQAGLVTVSGLAYGLDMEVALATLDKKGKTIAVLGGGLDSIYPSQNTSLAEEIVEKGGLLISLYPPLRRPTQYSFLERNRVISGLSLGTIIIEAGESSGTLNTASHAIEQGRELFVVPANIFSEASAGSNRLIDQMPETFTISADHVLKVLNIENNSSKKTREKKQEIIGDEKLIVSALYEGALDFDTLKERTKIDPKSLISKLTMLEISGLIKKLPNNFYELGSDK